MKAQRKIMNRDIHEKRKDLSAIKRLLYHPIYGPLSLLVTIIVFFFGLYNVPSKKLTFSIYPVKTSIVKSKQTSSLDIYYKKTIVTSDVSAIQIALWNSGKREIESEDILEPITIFTERKTPILEASIKKVSRGLIDLALDTSKMNAGELPINWRVLEKNDGGLIQIIYAGDIGVGFNIKGTIKGQRRLRTGNPIIPKKKRIPLSTVFLFFMVIIVKIFGSPWLVPEDYPQKIPGHIKLLFIFAFLVLIIGSIYALIVSGYVPPFGFE